MIAEVQAFNEQQEASEKKICAFLASEIDKELTEATSKIWHGHPVWFLEDNPIVGYSKQKKGIRLLFWSGADFNEGDLNILGKKFKDASIFYTAISEIDTKKLKLWLQKSRTIQWDYKNIVKRKGKLLRIK